MHLLSVFNLNLWAYLFMYYRASLWHPVLQGLHCLTSKKSSHQEQKETNSFDTARFKRKLQTYIILPESSI